MGTKDISKET